MPHFEIDQFYIFILRTAYKLTNDKISLINRICEIKLIKMKKFGVSKYYTLEINGVLTIFFPMVYKSSVEAVIRDSYCYKPTCLRYKRNVGAKNICGYVLYIT